MPQLMQIIEDEAEYVSVIEDQRRGDPMRQERARDDTSNGRTRNEGEGILNGTRHRKRVLTKMTHRAMKRGARGVDVTKYGTPNSSLGQRLTRSHTLNLHCRPVGNPWFLFQI
jgi:hypothetical protein